MTMQRAMAKQAEAEREKRAKVIHAEGELLASNQLAQAAKIIGSQPAACNCAICRRSPRCGRENSTIIFPLPLDLIEPMLDADAIGRQASARGSMSHCSNGLATNEPALPL